MPERWSKREALQRYRKSKGAEDVVAEGGFYLHASTWEGLAHAAMDRGTSLSGLAETLLRRGLKLPKIEEPEA